MISELSVALSSEQERCKAACDGMKEEHLSYRSKAKRMMQEKDQEIASLRQVPPHL